MTLPEQIALLRDVFSDPMVEMTAGEAVAWMPGVTRPALRTLRDEGYLESWTPGARQYLYARAGRERK